MADRSVLVRLRVDSSGVVTGAAQAERAVRGVGQEIERTSRKGKQDLQTVGLAAAAVGVAGAASLKLMTDAAVGFESGMADVAKTVDGSASELDALGQSLREMSTRDVPVAVRGLTDIAASAGQLGIETDNILGFTRVIADLGVATNLSGEQAATSLARLANITGMAQTDFDRLGSTVVDLGNNLATTEAEITDMGLRIAGAGTQIGLTEAEIFGLAGALSSVGIAAEAGGTAISRVMIDLASAVSAGGDELNQFSTIAGMSADAFASAWRADPADALITFVEGLGQVEAQGGDTFAVLEQLGMADVRVRDALLRMSGAGDVLRESIERGNVAWAENTALTEEAELRYATTESQIQFAKNAMSDLAIEMGQHLLPVIGGIASGVAGLAQLFGDLPDPVQKVAVAVTAVGTAVGLAGGAALLAIPKVMALKAELAGVGITAASTRASLLSLNTLRFTATAAGLVWLAGRMGDARREAADLAAAVRADAGDDPASQLAALNTELERANRIAGRGFSAFNTIYLNDDAKTAADSAEALGDEIIELEAAMRSLALEEEANRIHILSQATDGWTQRLIAANDATQATLAATNNFASGITSAGTASMGAAIALHSAQEATLSQRAAFEESVAAMASALSAFGGPMDAFEASMADGETSISEWIEAMLAAETAQADFADNMAILSTRVSDETFAAFLEMAERNPEQAALMAAEAVGLTEEELAELALVIGRAADEGEQALASRIENYRQMGADLGESAVAGLTGSLNDGTSEIARITDQYARAIASGVNPVIQQLNGTPVVITPGSFVPGSQGGFRTGDGPGFSGASVSMSAIHPHGDGPGFTSPDDVPPVPSYRQNAPLVQPGQLGSQKMRDDAMAWLEENLAPQLSGGVGWQAMWQALQQASGMGQIPGVDLFSAFRPGATTRSGNASYHSMGRAVDITPSMAIFEWLLKNYGSQSREIIYSPANGRQIRNGSSHMYSGGVRADHWDHIHWAMANGGIVRATPGGTSTILGEGGSDEAVIPLDRPLSVFLSGASDTAIAALSPVPSDGYGRGNDSEGRALAVADQLQAALSADGPLASLVDTLAGLTTSAGEAAGFAPGIMDMVGPDSGVIGALAGGALGHGLTSGEIEGVIANINTLTESWEAQAAAQEEANRRAELWAEIHAAEADLAAADSTEERAAAQERLNDAVRATQAFDIEAATRAEAEAIAAVVAELEAAAALQREREANQEMLRIEALAPAERLAEISAEMTALEAEGLGHTDEWVQLLREAEGLQGEIAQSARATAQEIERQAQAQRDAADAAQRQADQVASELDRMLDQRDRIIDQQADATSRYAQAVADAQRRAASDIDALLAARNDALFGAFGGVDNLFSTGWGNTVGQLTSNIEAQIDLFDEWADGMAVLRDRGISEDLIAQLGLDDPASLAQVRMLLQANAGELAELDAALAARRAQTAGQVAEESDLLLGALGDAITEVRVRLAETMADLHEDLTATLADLGVQMAEIGLDSGRTYAEMIAEGIASGLPGILAQVALVEDALADAKAAAAAVAALSGWVGPSASNPNPSGASGAGGLSGMLGNVSSDDLVNPFAHLFDSGGILPPGLTLANNQTGGNEYVLTPEQMRSMRPASGGQRAPVVNVYLGNRVINDHIRVEVDGRMQQHHYNEQLEGVG